MYPHLRHHHHHHHHLLLPCSIYSHPSMAAHELSAVMGSNLEAKIPPDREDQIQETHVASTQIRRSSRDLQSPLLHHPLRSHPTNLNHPVHLRQRVLGWEYFYRLDSYYDEQRDLLMRRPKTVDD